MVGRIQDLLQAFDTTRSQVQLAWEYKTTHVLITHGQSPAIRGSGTGVVVDRAIESNHDLIVAAM